MNLLYFKKFIFRILGYNLYHYLAFQYFKIKRRRLDENELQFLELVKTYIINGSTVLDIGANVGLWSKSLADFVGVKGEVIAFEPIKESYKMLQYSCKSYNNIEAFNLALTDNDETKEILINPISFAPPDAAIFDTAIHLKNKNNFKKIKIHIDKLDNYENLIKDDLSFIKIDVEEHELQVIKGGINLIGKYKPTLFIEILHENWIDKNPGDSELSRYLDVLGYKIGQMQKTSIEFKKQNFLSESENFIFVNKS